MGVLIFQSAIYSFFLQLTQIHLFGSGLKNVLPKYHFNRFCPLGQIWLQFTRYLAVLFRTFCFFRSVYWHRTDKLYFTCLKKYKDLSYIICTGEVETRCFKTETKRDIGVAIPRRDFGVSRPRRDTELYISCFDLS